MKAKEKYSVDIFRLKTGEHQFEFGIGTDFFTAFKDSPVQKATGRVDLNLIKQDSLIQAILDFHIELPLICDRSLREFNYPIEEQHEILFKYGEEEMEMDDDVYVITRNTQRIDFSQFIYEFIVLAVPMKKIHPDLVLEEEEEFVYRTEAETEESNEMDETDPRWEMLKKLRKN